MASYPSSGLYHPPKTANISLTPESPLQGLTKAAHRVLKRHIASKDLYQTRLQRSSLPENPYLKLESEQITRSFKARGALNKLQNHATSQGVVTASTGNHALAIAHAASVYGHPCTIFLPTCATDAKKERLRDTGVEVRVAGDDCLAAELAARSFAQFRGLVYVSPYNDMLVAAGQGTIACEILEQLDSLPRSVYVTVGGGGLIAGIAAVLKPLGWRVVGCQPERSAVMLRCVEAGCVVDTQVGETLSDGSAGCLEQGCVTLPYCSELVDVWIVVSEEEIREGIVLMEKEGFVVEGAAGVAVAGYMKDFERVGEGVIIVCGGNVGKG